jgi:hypothetical protein
VLRIAGQIFKYSVFNSSIILCGQRAQNREITILHSCNTLSVLRLEAFVHKTFLCKWSSGLSFLDAAEISPQSWEAADLPYLESIIHT